LIIHIIFLGFFLTCFSSLTFLLICFILIRSTLPRVKFNDFFGISYFYLLPISFDYFILVSSF
jgi:NADH:ubiquinone oxidoreductase subunit H